MTDDEKLKFGEPITALAIEARLDGHEALFAALSWLGGAILIGKVDVAERDAREHIAEYIDELKRIGGETRKKCEL